LRSCRGSEFFEVPFTNLLNVVADTDIDFPVVHATDAA
jgi:hypothetical protein